MAPRIRRPALVALAAFAISALLAMATPVGALAHGVIVGRQDLPVPEWLFAWAAAVVLVVSFIALTFAWHTARFEEDGWRPVPAWLSRLVVNRGTEIGTAAFGVFLLGVVIYAGAAGTSSPDRNLAVTFVFVTFWLGLVVVSALLGDVFRALNPWRAVARALASTFTLVAGQSGRAPFRYPERLGRWPAAIGIAAFFWFELVYSVGLTAVGVTPNDVAVAASLYSLYSLGGMALFGIEKWCERGEAFSVFYGMFSRLAPLEVRGRRLGARRWLAGTTSWVTVPGSVALVLITIGATAFDGASEGVLSDAIGSTYDALKDLGFDQLLAYRATNTIFLVASILAVSGLFWAGVRGMDVLDRARSTGELGRLFAHSFIPIALAYLVAHYFSLFVFAEQAQFTYLLSDPLGHGSDLFGTASGGIDYGLISATSIWYVQVGALIAGHVLALVLAHDRAISLYGDSKLAARSQYWMLALMVGFTTLGLFLLSQGNM
jgi:hypothetical protein